MAAAVAAAARAVAEQDVVGKLRREGDEVGKLLGKVRAGLEAEAEAAADARMARELTREAIPADEDGLLDVAVAHDLLARGWLDAGLALVREAGLENESGFRPAEAEPRERTTLASTVQAGNVLLEELAKYREFVPASVVGGGGSWRPRRTTSAAQQQQQDEEGEELPISVDLSELHPTLICPVSRQVTSPADPPVLLSCGHIVAKSSMLKLSRMRKFKCPTCPAELSLDDPMLELKFE